MRAATLYLLGVSVRARLNSVKAAPEDDLTVMFAGFTFR